MELARGAVRDPPWGLTLGLLAQRATTAELTIVEGATHVVLVIEDGMVVAGTSTLAAPTLLERAARTFELSNATYTVNDEITLVARQRVAAIDLREVVFVGAYRYLGEDQLHQQLRQLGTRFSLGSGGAAELPRYGTDAPIAIGQTLREAASLAELELAHPDIDRRALHAFVYALVSCGAVRGILPARAPTPAPEASRTITPSRATPVPPEALSRTTTPSTPRAPTPSTPRAPTPETPGAPPGVGRAQSPNDSGALLARIPTVNIARTPTPPSVSRKSSPSLAEPRTATTKDALPPLDLDARARENKPRAATIREPEREAAKIPSGRGGPQSRATPSHGVRIIAPDDEAMNRASEAAERARRLLKAHEYAEAQREALAASRLLPDSFDYQALSAWATFCGSRDKPAAADATRKLLEKASHRAAAPHEVRLMLGKLERAVGREREALRHFRAVLERDPTHVEAATQIRELEAQLEAFARR